LLSLIVSGCTSKPAGKELSGTERDNTIAYIDPITDNILKGLAEGNYQEFSRDFNEKMAAALNQQQFETTKKQLDEQFGAYQSRSLTQAIDYGDMVTAVYTGVFSKSPKVQILVTVTKADPHKVSGLYFRP
jgi:hypothetical protein